MVCGADGENARRKAGVLKTEPVLVLPIGADVEVRHHLVVHAEPASYHVVREICATSIGQGWEVEDAAAVHHFGVRDKLVVAAKVAAPDLVGLFVEIGGILDEMKLAFNADVRQKVEVDVSGAAVIAAAVV